MTGWASCDRVGQSSCLRLSAARRHGQTDDKRPACGLQEQLRREEDVYCKQLSIKLMARLEAGPDAAGAGGGSAGERWRREAKELCDAPGGVELLGMIGYVYCQARPARAPGGGERAPRGRSW